MPESWGLLPKSQIDDETIEEAIARLILAHNEDETAHLGTGQSLQSHKASEIIDHAIASIIADKIKSFEIPIDKLSKIKYSLCPSFESLDAWTQTGTGTATLRLGYLHLMTLDALDSTKRVRTPNDEMPANFAAKNPCYEANVKFFQAASQLSYFGMGEYDGEFIGFKVNNGVLYACTRTAGYSATYEISGVTLTNFNNYRAVYFSGAKIEFYVNGVLKYTQTTNLSTETYVPKILDLFIKNQTTTYRSMLASDIKFFQDR